MRLPVDDAACGAFVVVGGLRCPRASATPTSPEPGSGETSQRSALLKKVVGLVMWYAAVHVGLRPEQVLRVAQVGLDRVRHLVERR